MESTRQKKISRLLQKDLAIIFQQDAPAILGNILFTITGVKVSPDLSVAIVLVSVTVNKAMFTCIIIIYDK